MAIRIEKGGWLLVFLLGLALVAYSLHGYGILDLGDWFGGAGKGKAAEPKPLENSPQAGEQPDGVALLFPPERFIPGAGLATIEEEVPVAQAAGRLG
ncbi:MAG TPA: hypothetical protein PLA43_00175 [Bryobacteraceae bacterium]|nr:hypothetical protein [Bryobacteraceae bacterium]HOL72656.1 hypothetical protein [Bryobacteraceae bacterium]HOQ44022.1 hypothetical protein [Bryobacteraceae bacterium]HPQ13841.1 hypothetical protein [Bryobacteraceae bacterium]HPU70340.1 hypothetical protein [Bryobacteraceae bacterium]